PVEGSFRRPAHAQLAGQGVFSAQNHRLRDHRLHDLRHQGASATKTERAKPSGTLSRRPLIRTSIGPSNWLPATTAMGVPGVRPRRSSSRSLTGSASETRWTMTFSPARHSLRARWLTGRTFPGGV